MKSTTSPLVSGIRSCFVFAVVSMAVVITLAVYLPRMAVSRPQPVALLPTVTLTPEETRTPLPTSTPDPDVLYFTALGAWIGDTAAWVSSWSPLLDLPVGSAEWNDGWGAVVREGDTLAGRLHLLPVHAGRTNMHGLAESTFDSCLRAAQAFHESDVYGGRLYMSLCTTGSTLLTDKIRRER